MNSEQERDSLSRVSRNNRLVRLNPKYFPHTGNTFPDPELTKYHKNCIEAIDGFAAIPANCRSCGHRLQGDYKEKRVTILIHDGENANTAAVYCRPCFDRLEIPLQRGNIRYSSRLDQKIWELHARGLKQGEIAKQLTNQHQRVTQPAVSRSLKRTKEAQRHLRNARMDTNENPRSCIN